MKIFAIADLHLSLSIPEKTMEIFSENWKDYHNKIETNWKNIVTKNDLVLIPGDLCWAIKLKDALIDLEWIHNLPGKKIIIKGNHDYWWPSFTKLKNALPPSIEFLQNNAISFNDITIAGARLWDTQEFNFDEYIDFLPNPKKNKDLEKNIQLDLSEKIFSRELERLKLSLDQMNKNAKIKIVMTHYPPISADLKDSKASKLLEKYYIDICIFGHLHNVKKNKKMFGEKNNIKYILTSADYIDFKPIQIF
jgi:predicted phosphohydrolase